MKKLAGLVVILAILVLGGYYGMGVVTERAVKHDLDTVNQSNGLLVQVVKYKRGWFTSSAELKWRLHLPERATKDANGQPQVIPAQDYDVDMPLHIYHGPFIFVDHTIKFGLGYARTDIPLPEQYREKFNNYFTSESTQPTLDLSLFVNYFNSSQIEMSIPPFKLITKEGGGEFDWKGMVSSIKVTSDEKKIGGDLSINGLQFTKGETKAEMGKLTSDYNLHKTAIGLYLGDANLSLPSFYVSTNNKKIFELNSLDIRTSSDIENGLFNSYFKLSVDQVIASDRKFGPGSLEIAVRNLDAQALARIKQQADRARYGSSDLEKQKAVLAMLPEIPTLFGQGAEFEITQLNFVMPEGTMDGNLSVSLPKGKNGNFFEIIQKIQGKGKLKVPSDVVKRVLNESNKQKIMAKAGAKSPLPQIPDQLTVPTDASAQPSTAGAGSADDISQQVTTMTNDQIATMLQSGAIVQDGNYYVVELNLQQGKLQVNNKPFNASMIKF